MELLKAILHFDDREIILAPKERCFETELFINFTIEELPSGGKRIKLEVHPKQKVLLKKIALVFKHDYGNAPIFCNGYQSWTESREFSPDEQMPSLHPLVRKLMEPYGDYGIVDYSNQKGDLHSWTYTYTRSGKKLNFLGALNEFTGFTLFQHHAAKGELHVSKDCAGLGLDHSYPAFDLYWEEGAEKEIFDRYFELQQFTLKAAPIVGWTSWYHYYTNISEKIILDNTQAFAEKGMPIDIIQIDDGYQERVGDWLAVKPSFPNGMAAVANKIHETGYKAGLWLAPFICEKKSKLFEQHPDWILHDDKGKPISAGWNPMWSGHFYILDFYHPKVQEYLASVFYTVLEKWGFDLVKLDFLYAVALQPRPNKTRGQIMSEAMKFLRRIVGEKLILGCGVPLGAAFGTVDYCRIGADVHLGWEHGLLKWCRNRERVSTILALRSTLGRWQLNGRAFHNDPDVFILRKEKNDLTTTQQYTLMIVNVLLGNLLFTSDFLGTFNEEQLDEYRSVFHWKESQVSSVEQPKMDVYLIYFTQKEKKFIATVNLTKRKVEIAVSKQKIKLKAYETFVLSDLERDVDFSR